MIKRIFQAVGAVTLVLIAGVGSAPCARAQSSQETDRVAPTDLFIVTTWDDDFYPYWQTKITHVLQRPDGVLVTYTYVQSATQPCNEPDVKSTERLLPSTKIEALTAPLNLCALNPERINALAKRYMRGPKPFETSRTGIVVNCGGTQKVFRLPNFAMNKDTLERKSPETVELTRLEIQLLSRTFGKEDLNKLISQQIGDEKLRDLKTDKFKSGFWFCLKGEDPAIAAGIEASANSTPLGDCDWLKLQQILASYKHPAQGIRNREARLINPIGYRLLKYVAVDYPPLFVLRRMQGTVELELKVSQETGYVEDAKVIRGPDYLSSIAEDAARRWQFDPKQTISNPVKLSIEFSLRCGD